MSSMLKLKIKGMTCGSCSNSITTRVNKFEFTDNVNIDWEAGSGTMEITSDFEGNKAQVVQVIGQMGYEVSEA
ncbi:MAG: heavy-metal-associated domain-containing protein [Candidatus Heimdallarchaeota archaeon]